MDLQRFGLRLIADGPPRSGGVWLARLFLAACARAYDVGLEIYLGTERVGLRRRAHLPVPVVSIGNLTVGGTGKTPMTQFLCRLLVAHGKRVAVLSRGHGSKSAGVRLVSDGQGLAQIGADDAGDEPLLLARTLPGTPVLVGKDRRLSGREALNRFASDVLVLDDGFQFWQLARVLDIVLLDARRPFDNGYPLPRGLLREPKRHLRRAGIVVVTRAESLETEARDALIQKIALLAPAVEVYFARHRAAGFVPVGDPTAAVRPLEMLRGARVVALSGIAQPQSFAQLLTDAAELQVARHLIYSDHARYAARDAMLARRVLQEEGAAALVMTEKDAVKWPFLGEDDLPVYALRIEIQIEDEARFLAAVMRRVAGE